jgi:hypothetical protein
LIPTDVHHNNRVGIFWGEFQVMPAADKHWKQLAEGEDSECVLFAPGGSGAVIGARNRNARRLVGGISLFVSGSLLALFAITRVENWLYGSFFACGTVAISLIALFGPDSKVVVSPSQIEYRGARRRVLLERANVASFSYNQLQPCALWFHDRSGQPITHALNLVPSIPHREMQRIMRTLGLNEVPSPLRSARD